MEHLWAPWRMDYILANRKGRRCIFCPAGKHADEKRLIVYRTPLSLVMLNRYPYSYAHLMIAPVRHVQDVSKLKPEEMKDIFHNIGQSINVLKEAFRPKGFNVGMNLGQVGGAGILHHLHFHIIPRWKGDMNFMPILAEVRIIPEHLKQTYDKLRLYFKKLENW
ncbi:MAG: HIT domain-containing protein [Deltaproteobacteria bacterium]|nr:HIT domain-containing protein [Deltaproteobacteria bacterium]